MKTLEQQWPEPLPPVEDSAPREHNRVCPEGRKLGEQMARLCDHEIKKLITEGEYEEDERCASCAFRLGTVPNGCLQTQLDVMKAVLEHEAFFCHAVETPGTKVCAGWFASVQSAKKYPKVICPWPYSPPDDETQEHNQSTLYASRSDLKQKCGFPV